MSKQSSGAPAEGTEPRSEVAGCRARVASTESCHPEQVMSLRLTRDDESAGNVVLSAAKDLAQGRPSAGKVDPSRRSGRPAATVHPRPVL